MAPYQSSIRALRPLPTPGDYSLDHDIPQRRLAADQKAAEVERMLNGTSVDPARRLPKRVRDLSTGTIHRSVNQAGQSIGMNPANIARAIRNGWTVDGHRFAFVEESPPMRIRETRTGRTFETMTAAAIAFGVSRSRVYKAIRNGSMCSGNHFERI